jgi:hypothetical protein
MMVEPEPPVIMFCKGWWNHPWAVCSNMNELRYVLFLINHRGLTIGKLVANSRKWQCTSRIFHHFTYCTCTSSVKMLLFVRLVLLELWVWCSVRCHHQTRHDDDENDYAKKKRVLGLRPPWLRYIRYQTVSPKIEQNEGIEGQGSGPKTIYHCGCASAEMDMLATVINENEDLYVLTNRLVHYFHYCLLLLLYRATY